MELGKAVHQLSIGGKVERTRYFLAISPMKLSGSARARRRPQKMPAAGGEPLFAGGKVEQFEVYRERFPEQSGVGRCVHMEVKSLVADV